MTMPARSDMPTAAPRRAARDIIDAVVENMRASREPLKYSVLVPCHFTVYVHPSEFARLQHIVPLLQGETARALSEALGRMNRHTRVSRLARKLAGHGDPALCNPAGDWQIEFVADPDGELKEGDVLVDSQLVIPERPELSVGQQTRRITTVRRGGETSVLERTAATPKPAVVAASTPPRALAQITYEDEGGHHVHEVVSDSLSIGRGGATFPVDLRIASSPDVSREHARIRRDGQSGRFYLIDLSSLGTTLNGRHVPRGYDEVDGRKRENGAETALPDSARIGLADTVFLDFKVLGR